MGAFGEEILHMRESCNMLGKDVNRMVILCTWYNGAYEHSRRLSSPIHVR